MNPCKVYTTIFNSRKYVMIFLISLALPYMTSSCIKDILSENRDNFTGTWSCSETTSSKKAAFFYHVTISKSDTETDMIRINNFYNVKAYVDASISGNDMTIALQSSEGFGFSGSGSYSTGNKKITLSYTIDDGSGTLETATASYTRD